MLRNLPDEVYLLGRPEEVCRGVQGSIEKLCGLRIGLGSPFGLRPMVMVKDLEPIDLTS